MCVFLASNFVPFINSSELWKTIRTGLYRATVVLAHYRSFSFAESSILSSNPRFDAYLSRLFAHPSFAATCSDEALYLDSYERYAFNRPDTSQVAKAVNEGRGLP